MNTTVTPSFLKYSGETTERGPNEEPSETVGMGHGDEDDEMVRHSCRSKDEAVGQLTRNSVGVASSPGDLQAPTPATTPPLVPGTTTGRSQFFTSTTTTHASMRVNAPAPDSTTVLSPRCMNSSDSLLAPVSSAPIESSPCQRPARGLYPGGMLDELGAAESSSNPLSFSPSNVQVAFAPSLESNSSLDEVYYGPRGSQQKENQKLSLPRLSSSSSSLAPFVFKLGQRREAPPVGASAEEDENEDDEEKEEETALEEETSKVHFGTQDIVDCYCDRDDRNNNDIGTNDGVEMIYGGPVVSSTDGSEHDDRIGVAVVWKDSSAKLDHAWDGVFEEDISEYDDDEDPTQGPRDEEEDDDEFFLANPATLQEEKRWKKNCARRVVSSSTIAANSQSDDEEGGNVRLDIHPEVFSGHDGHCYKEKGAGLSMCKTAPLSLEKRTVTTPFSTSRFASLSHLQPTANINTTTTIGAAVTSRLESLSLCPRPPPPPPPMASCVPPPTRRTTKSRSTSRGNTKGASSAARRGRVTASSLYPFVATKSIPRSVARGEEPDPMDVADPNDYEDKDEKGNDYDVQSPDCLGQRQEHEGGRGLTGTSWNNPVVLWKTPRSAPSALSNNLSPLEREGRGGGLLEGEEFQGTPSSLPLLRRDQSVLGGTVASPSFLLTNHQEGAWCNLDAKLSSSRSFSSNNKNKTDFVVTVVVPSTATATCCEEDEDDDNSLVEQMSPRLHARVPSPWKEEHAGAFGMEHHEPEEAEESTDLEMVGANCDVALDSLVKEQQPRFTWQQDASKKFSNSGEAPDSVPKSVPMTTATDVENRHLSGSASELVRPPPHFLQPRGLQPTTTTSYDTNKTNSTLGSTCSKSRRKRKEGALSPPTSGTQ